MRIDLPLARPGSAKPSHREASMRLAAATLLALSGTVLFPAHPAEAAGVTDITAAVLAGTDVTLAGASIINLPQGTTTYKGVLSGQGTLTIAGAGTLLLTRDSDVTLPSSDQHQSLSTNSGNSPYPVLSNPDRPAVIVERGATLQYGNGGSTGIIGDYPYPPAGRVPLNHDNIEVEGTLVLDITGREYNLGTISGSGLISQPRFTWGTLDLVGSLPFTGTIANGTGMTFGNVAYHLSLPSAAQVRNDGSAIISANDYTLVLPEDFYEDHYGDDINFHTWNTGLIEMTGVDHYTDPSLDTASIAHTPNYRGINIGSANVQWGDGSSQRFFLPATPSNSYINIQNGSLAFDYNGPVTLATPISGGTIHDSLSTPANASITLAPHPGNAVTFAVPMNYHGATTIGGGATLLLGTGQPGGDSGLLTGTAKDQVHDDGMLVVRNTSTATTLQDVSGTGGLQHSGAATTTLTGATGYTGPTTISAGTLAIGSGASGIAASSSLTLSSSTARFSVASSGSGTVQHVRQLSGAPGSAIELGSTTLAVATSGSTTFAGSITGDSGGLTTTGTGTLALTGHTSTPDGTWHGQQGTLAIGPGGDLRVGSLIQSPGSTLSLAPGRTATTPAGAPVQVSGTVRLAGPLAVPTVAPIPAGGHVVLIHTTGPRPVSGTFTGLPQGAHLTVDGQQFTIDYAGDSGHDVVLTNTGTGTSAPAVSAAAGTPVRGSSVEAGPDTGSPVQVAAGAGTAALAVAAGSILVARRRRRAAAPEPNTGTVPATPARPARHRHRR
ncbi:autotransporter-associated beta strand protein [Streptomyces sp. 846.5]|nr:autotransporter-associated beta strand repeat-containing protein [Streptomyces sp. 846.5]TDU03395.1 autotransporter-associated beta strand protein [Streptomyces sp. 846.5]